MNPLGLLGAVNPKYVFYLVVAVAIAWAGLSYKAERDGRLLAEKLAEDTKVALLAQTVQVEVANQNMEEMGNAYSELQQNTESERKAKVRAEQLAYNRGRKLQQLIANLDAAGGDSMLNQRLREAFESARGFPFDNQQDLLASQSPDFGHGKWFCFDQTNTFELINNIELMADYITADQVGLADL